MAVKRFFLGVDLGKQRDATAIAVVERAEVAGDFDWALFAPTMRIEFHIRHLERLRLSTEYSQVVEHVRRLARRVQLSGSVTVVVDASGLGAPVVEMLRKADPSIRLLGVTITASGPAREVPGGWHVSREELLNSLAAAVERRDLKAASRAPGIAALVDELTGLRIRSGRVAPPSEGHDDIVVAVALAYWRARSWRDCNGRVRLL